MSFVEFLQDDPQLTREQVMQALIQVANELGMPDKRGACVIAGVIISQEVGVVDNDPPRLRRFWCPANHNDEESFRYRHDTVSNDGRSVGYFQQQKGPDGELWWGQTSSEMDLHSAATQFMTRLKKAGYNASNANAAAASGCAIQNPADHPGYIRSASGFWSDINGLYDSVNKNAPVPDPVTPPPVSAPSFFQEHDIIDGSGSQDRKGRKPRLFILHTEEGNMTGQALDDWMDNNQVSYHYVVGNDGVAWDLVDTDLASWSVLDANNYTINLVFAPSFASWTRNEWLANMGTGIKIAAYLCAQDCKKYGIPPVVRVGNSASGYPSLATNDGVTDHYGITVGLGIGNHTDVGKFFPWDVFNTYLQQFSNGLEDDDDMFTDEDRAMLKQVHFELTNPWNSASMYAAKDETPFPGNTLVGVGLAIDSMTHAKVVEDQALKGDADSIMRILRTAAGEGLYGDDPRVVKRATAAAEEIPQDILKAYEDAQK